MEWLGNVRTSLVGCSGLAVKTQELQTGNNNLCPGVAPSLQSLQMNEFGHSLDAKTAGAGILSWFL